MAKEKKMVTLTLTKEQVQRVKIALCAMGKQQEETAAFWGAKSDAESQMFARHAKEEEQAYEQTLDAVIVCEKGESNV